jgi:hypothetical protein
MAKRRMIVIVPEEVIADVVNFCLAHSIEMHIVKERDTEEEEGVILGPAPAHMRKAHQRAHLLEHREHEHHPAPSVPFAATGKGSRGPYKKRKPQTPAKYPNFPRKEAEAMVFRMIDENGGQITSKQLAAECVRLHINESAMGHATMRLRKAGQIVTTSVNMHDGATYRRAAEPSNGSTLRSA